MGSRATSRPVRSPLARPAGTGLPAAGVEGLRPVFPGGWGRSAEMADRLPGFANQSPFHVVS